ncbi:NADH:ubiquinone oxidoreductase [Aciduliprofundum sp. MAR08-339]|uniref:NADH-quinone oxidoreductase subunit B family protein n=1 Tax=Aciduliprofundum sp. (strain MAR08-339) TaxID=673860 RepID=UPI00064FA67E
MKIGIFSLSCCEGCSVQFLNLENEILEILKYMGIGNFRLAKEINEWPVDIAFIEGTPTNGEEISKLLRIRRDSKILVALGVCAATGGVPALVNTMEKRDAIMVYDGMPPKMPVDPKPLEYYVDVDYTLYGCPFSIDELKALLTSVIMGKRFRNKRYSVCVECSLRENGCLLEEGYLCMGPITRAGCNALCTSNGTVCLGCRGPYEDANIKGHIKILRDMGFSKDEIIEAYSIFSYEKLKEVIGWLKEE